MRYIDADKLKEQLEDFSKWCRDGRKQGVDFVLDCPLPDIPTEDVVPRNEVEKARQVGYEMGKSDNIYGHSIDKMAKKIEELSIELELAKQEVAREIFEEIVKLLVFNTYEIACISKTDLAELKKKYIGE